MQSLGYSTVKIYLCFLLQNGDIPFHLPNYKECFSLDMSNNSCLLKLHCLQASYNSQDLVAHLKELKFYFEFKLCSNQSIFLI